MKLSPLKNAAAALVMALVTFAIFAEEETLRLADGGVTDYSVVLPETPTAVQRTTAGELASFLNQVTGATFPILSESQVEEQAKDKEKLLVIGPGTLSKRLLASVGAEPEESIGRDGIIIQPAGESIVFSGHPRRGPLYAVYTFLEDCVGCRWWTSTESTIPERPTLDIEVPQTRYAPKVISRESFCLDARQGNAGGIFSARMKMNGHYNPVPLEYGGHEPFCLFVHSFYPILPPKDYFAEHPDWYALVDGQRQDKNAQLCLTNPEMKEQFIRNALRFLDDDPDARIISISQNDCGRWCQCPECQKLVDENDSQAGPLITFVNDVAEAIEKERPDVLVETLAYQESRFAPKVVRPRDNVIIRLCTIENSFLTPLEEGGRNQSLLEHIEKWSAISKQLFIWDYVTNFINYMLPHPNLQVLGPNIRFFVRNKAVGIFEQGDNFCPAGDFVRMRNWVISKLLWNPDLDQRRLEDEFLNGYYSPKVGAILRRYLDLLTDRAVKSDVNLRLYMESAFGWLDTETLIEATKLMDQALAAAREDEELSPERFAGLADKIERESIPVHLAWLRDWPNRRIDLAARNLPSPVGDIEDYFQEYRALLEKYRVDCAAEGRKAIFGEWLDELHESLSTCVVVPDEVKDLANDTWLCVEEFNVRLGGQGKQSFLEDDAEAGNGKAIRLAGDHHDWSIQWDVSGLERLRSGAGAPPDERGYVKARILLRARCDAADGDDGDALSIGVYDKDTKGRVFLKTLKTTELSRDGYEIVDLGVLPVEGSATATLFWFAPTERPDAVQNIYIDRMVLIRE